MNESSPDTFSPRDTVQTISRFWWIIVLFMVLGASLGLLFHRLQNPVYEARAVLSTSINYARTGAMTDVEEDNAVGMVGDLIQSPAVRAKVLQAAKTQGISLSEDEFISNAFADRTGADWTLRVRSRSPQVAAALANLWVDQAYQALGDAVEHAIVADQLERYQDSLVTCLGQSTAVEPVQAVCQGQEIDTLHQDLQDTSRKIKAEVMASQGVLSALTFALSARAQVPTKPVLFGQNNVALAGSLIGLILAIWTVSSGWLDRRSRHG
jgi:hypothetical protein